MRKQLGREAAGGGAAGGEAAGKGEAGGGAAGGGAAGEGSKQCWTCQLQYCLEGTELVALLSADHSNVHTQVCIHALC